MLLGTALQVHRRRRTLPRSSSTATRPPFSGHARRARGPAAAPSLSPICSQGSRCGVEEGVERTSALGFDGENRAPVLFHRDQRVTVRWEWTDGD
jgi:hypothetical protein